MYDMVVPEMGHLLAVTVQAKHVHESGSQSLRAEDMTKTIPELGSSAPRPRKQSSLEASLPARPKLSPKWTYAITAISLTGTCVNRVTV